MLGLLSTESEEFEKINTGAPVGANKLDQIGLYISPDKSKSKSKSVWFHSILK